MCAKSRESRRYAGKEVKRTEKRCHKMEEIILRNARVSPCVPHTHIYSFPPTYAIGQLRPTKSRRDRWEGVNSARGRPTYILSAPSRWGHFQGLTLHTSWICSSLFVTELCCHKGWALYGLGWTGEARREHYASAGNIAMRQGGTCLGTHTTTVDEVPRLK